MNNPPNHFSSPKRNRQSTPIVQDSTLQQQHEEQSFSVQTYLHVSIYPVLDEIIHPIRLMHGNSASCPLELQPNVAHSQVDDSMPPVHRPNVEVSHTKFLVIRTRRG